MGRQTQLIGLSATVEVFLALRRGSDHLPWGWGVGGGVQERFLEHVNVLTSEAEKWGEYVGQKEQQECTHFTVEETAT